MVVALVSFTPVFINLCPISVHRFPTPPNMSWSRLLQYCFGGFSGAWCAVKSLETLFIEIQLNGIVVFFSFMADRYLCFIHYIPIVQGHSFGCKKNILGFILFISFWHAPFAMCSLEFKLFTQSSLRSPAHEHLRLLGTSDSLLGCSQTVECARPSHELLATVECFCCRGLRALWDTEGNKQRGRIRPWCSHRVT